jgi:hypothetical protein
LKAADPIDLPADLFPELPRATIWEFGLRSRELARRAATAADPARKAALQEAAAEYRVLSDLLRARADAEAWPGGGVTAQLVQRQTAWLQSHLGEDWPTFFWRDSHEVGLHVGCPAGLDCEGER